MAKMGQPLGEEGGCTMGIIWGGWGRGLGWGRYQNRFMKLIVGTI